MNCTCCDLQTGMSRYGTFDSAQCPTCTHGIEQHKVWSGGHPDYRWRGRQTPEDYRQPDTDLTPWDEARFDAVDRHFRRVFGEDPGT